MGRCLISDSVIPSRNGMGIVSFAIDVNERRIWIMTKLFKAIRQNDIETVKKVLHKYPEKVNCMATAPPKKDEGQSPLQVAIKVGNIEIAHYLIDQGADVNHM